MVLEIRDLDESASKEDVIEALNEKLGSSNPERTVSVVPRFRGTKLALVRLPETEYFTLIKAGKIRIGWINAAIREHLEVPRCQRCFGFGHATRLCKGPDRIKNCRRCGKAGHMAKSCEVTDPSCITCC